MKVISINGSRFVLPEGMATKDVQALAGFMITLTPVQTEYDYDTGAYMSCLSAQGVEVRVDEVSTMMDMAAAKKQHEESHTRYKAKRDAEATAA